MAGVSYPYMDSAKQWTVRAPSGFLALMLVVGVTLPLSAYDWPLSPEAVREAYFFGRSSDRGKVAKFLGEYVRHFPPQGGNSAVGIIELRTPYQHVVQQSWENQAGYSAQQAQIDYASHANLVEVRVYISFHGAHPTNTDSYTNSKGQVLDHREDFWRKYRFLVVQEHDIQPIEIQGTPIYGHRGQGLSGADVRLVLDAASIAPQGARIEVIDPEGQRVTTDFALDQMR
jgi:hypothetical protein